MNSPRKSIFANSIRNARSKGGNPSTSVSSIYAVHRVTIEPGDEMKAMFAKTQATLEEINATLQKLAGKDKDTSQIIEDALSKPLCEAETSEEIDEPKELSVSIPEPLREPGKYGHIVYAKDLPDEFNYVKEYPALKWKDNGNGKLMLEYHGASVDKITWGDIEKLLKIPKKNRMPEILKIKDVGSSNSKKTAISVFCQCVERGLITPPSVDPDIELENNYTQFVQEEDIDAPMLAKYYSTRPDANCGKVEDSLEVV